jgi:DNA-binding response OmpR family regulator
VADILIVEDDASVARVLELAFGVEGHAVELVADGPSALARLRSTPVDLVVLDVLLPDADGLALLRELRSREAWEDTRVIVLSALDGDEDLWRGWSSGTDSYVTKPFDLGELRAIAARLLARGEGSGDAVVVEVPAR